MCRCSMYKVLIHLVFLGIASSSAPGFSKGAAQKGLEFVLKSIVQGFNFTPTTYHHDPHFKTLKNDKTFKEHLNYWKNKTL